MQIRRKVEILKEYTKMLYGLHGKRLILHLGIFCEIESIYRQAGAGLS